jgi:hypothetical protein
VDAKMKAGKSINTIFNKYKKISRNTWCGMKPEVLFGPLVLLLLLSIWLSSICSIWQFIMHLLLFWNPWARCAKPVG